MFVPGEAAVEHRRAGKASAPGVWIADVAPGVVAQPLLQVAAAVGDCRPGAEVVLQDVVDPVLPAARLHHGVNARGAGEIGEAPRSGRPGGGLRDVFAVPDVALGPDGVPGMLLHGDPLMVEAVGVNQAVVALLDFQHLVEARVCDGLGR